MLLRSAAEHTSHRNDGFRHQNLVSRARAATEIYGRLCTKCRGEGNPHYGYEYRWATDKMTTPAVIEMRTAATADAKIDGDVNLPRYRCRRVLEQIFHRVRKKIEYIKLFFLFFLIWGVTRSIRMPTLRPASQAGPMRNPGEGTSVVLRYTIRLT